MSAPASRLIPLDRIEADALPRDRTRLDPAALDELQASIAAHGLRQPIEVFETPTGYGLVSGYRRLAALRRLHALTGDPRHARIAAVILPAADRAALLARMVEENEIRADLSPWERASIAIAARDDGTFPTLDAALAALFPHAGRPKRARIRGAAEVVEALEGVLADPEALSERQLLRIAGALRLGWRELIVTAVEESGARTAAAQWEAMRPVLAEAETLLSQGRDTRPTRPRRLLRPRPGLTIRRERTPHGYLLHVTGRAAHDALVAEILDEIERLFGA